MQTQKQPDSTNSGKSVRQFSLGDGLGELDGLRDEIDSYWDVLLGRVDPPVNKGISTLMEVAEAYHARANEIFSLIQRKEATGQIMKTGALYKFRTGELRTFIEATKRTVELGSRRITMAGLEFEFEDFPSG